MARRFFANLLMAFGLVLLALGLTSWIAGRTYFSPERVEDASQTMLQSPAVANVVEEIVSAQVEQALPPELGVSDDQIDAAVTQALSDPRFASAFSSALVQFHQRLLGDAEGDVTVDTTGLTAAVQDALVQQNPALAGSAAAIPPLQLELPTESLPQFKIAEKVDRFSRLSILGGIFIVCAAALVHPKHHKVMIRAGLFLLVIGATNYLLFVLWPRWAVQGIGDDSGFSLPATILATLGEGAKGPSKFLMLIGVGLAALGFFWGQFFKAYDGRSKAPAAPQPPPQVAYAGAAPTAQPPQAPQPNPRNNRPPPQRRPPRPGPQPTQEVPTIDPNLWPPIDDEPYLDNGGQSSF